MNHHIERLDRVPIFPLTGVFLFPGLILPLHMFEPRYVQMTEAATAGDGLICMASPDRKGVEGALGSPPVRPIGGLGRIRSAERLPDGRYNLELVGIGRIELIEELASDALFRRVRARSLQSVAGEGDLEAAQTARALIRSLVQLGDEHLRRIARLADADIEPARLSDVLPGVLLHEPDAMLDAFEDLSIAGRLDRCVDDLKSRLIAAAPGGDLH